MGNPAFGSRRRLPAGPRLGPVAQSGPLPIDRRRLTRQQAVCAPAALSGRLCCSDATLSLAAFPDCGVTIPGAPHQDGVSATMTAIDERRAAFGALAEECWGRAFAVALSILRDRHEAEEAVQEALLTAFVKIGTLRDRDRFDPWLARIVQNEARGRLRRRRAPTIPDVASLPSRVAQDEPERAWTDGRLATALGALTYNQRVTVTLRFLVGLAPREIADFLGLSGESVRKRLHDGLTRLRTLGAAPPQPHAGGSAMPTERKEALMTRIPNVLSAIDTRPDDEEPRADRPLMMSILDRLLEDRIVVLSGRIDTEAATSAAAQFLFLQRANGEAPVHLYINSQGGDLFAGFAIHDTMQFLSCPVHTMAFGQATGIAALLLAAGEPGARRALPNTAVMLHQPPVGEESGLQEHFQEAAAAGFRGRLVQLFAKRTGADADKIDRDLARGVYLTTEQAQEYGILDNVV
jgi:ATP-dependent Clp protease, protease subunit